MIALLLFVLFQLAAPQQTGAPNPDDLCTIQGVVIKAGTGEPLHKATVDAWPAGHRLRDDQVQGGSAETDAMGRFEIKGLAPGRYYLSAQKNGYVRQQYGQRTPESQGAMLTLSAGEKLPVTFQMIPAAVISGHIYDEDGEPVVYAQVNAMHYGYEQGQRKLFAGSSAQTNDLGEFRIFGLAPGQYYVQAAVQKGRSAGNKNGLSYVPIYYPGVPDAARAAPITLRSGDEFPGVDISLQVVRALTLRGNVLASGCGDVSQGGMVFLGDQNAAGHSLSPTTVHDVNGQKTFEFSGVPPGSYYLSASVMGVGKQCAGQQALEVTDSDIDAIAVTVSPGIEIKCRLTVEGQLNSNPSSMSVWLSSKNRQMINYGYGANATAEADGTLVLKRVYDGTYDLNVGNLPDNFFVKSARLDGADVLTSGVNVDSKQAPGMLEILVSPNGASVDGAITKDQQPFQGATVAIIPDPPHRGERRLYNSTTTDQNGHFTLQGLAPGDYKVFAWEKIDSGAYTSPEFLQPYENLGESVHITEGSRNAVQVDLIPAPDTSP